MIFLHLTELRSRAHFLHCNSFLIPKHRFRGVILRPHHYGRLTADSFERRLKGAWISRCSVTSASPNVTLPSSFSTCSFPSGMAGRGEERCVGENLSGAVRAHPSSCKGRTTYSHPAQSNRLQCFVSVPLKLGFQFHHAHPDHVMMTQWLPTNEPNNLPQFAYHYIGEWRPEEVY